ncbi:MAG TPA: trypsin-like peptidase domain-containing protein [Vicinamibacteria bacterium]|nr:trypsin-like peptidase domain-containing protein [Vicinamibacteria bacterium]
MDGLVSIPRRAAFSVVFLRSTIPAEHPSAALLGEERFGAGVAIAPDRVLTAHYLVMGASAVELAGPDGRERGVLRAGLDHESGLALLSTAGEALPSAELGRSSAALPGTPVFIVTWTTERERKAQSGHVFRVGPFEAFWEYMLDRAIMTTILNPGLAGAPLFDARGRVVGIVSLGLAAVGRYSLAIPIDLFLEQREALEKGDARRPRRAWVGLFPQDAEGGVWVSGLVSGSPADRAGVLRGDLLLSIDGAAVGSVRELYREIWKRSPGETISLQVLRDSAITSLEVVAGDRYDFYR